MFNETGNRALLRIRITTRTPLLIRAGDTGLDPAGSDLKCVRTRRGDVDRTVYVPGSSLKGVVRSVAESSVRGRKLGGVDGACDPLSPTAACGERGRTRAGGPEIHREHCLACRVFGSLAMKGRAAIRDLFPWEGQGDELSTTDLRQMASANRTQVRFGVAINRVSGGVSHKKLFDMEIVPAGTSFWGEITLENYQVWQLGLLATAFDELEEGLAQLGSSKSRGLGVVGLTVASMVHEQAAHAGMHPAGIGAIVPEPRRREYGLLPEGKLPATEGRRRGLFVRFSVPGEQTKEWMEAGLEALGALA
ncbi:RAMP superfamily CRISPR-associated protein [Sorangium sp. So ce296]|uniref:RAMP superfamily CRISPR-associated protein n=1 Tax=Sorangium sp. So ce296 TaxID=3133296 RepID=UPI003F5E7FF5